MANESASAVALPCSKKGFKSIIQGIKNIRFSRNCRTHKRLESIDSKAAHSVGRESTGNDDWNGNCNNTDNSDGNRVENKVNSRVENKVDNNDDSSDDNSDDNSGGNKVDNRVDNKVDNRVDNKVDNRVDNKVDNSDDNDDSSDDNESDDDCSDRLIERGPIKSHHRDELRSKPYIGKHFIRVSPQQLPETNETFPLDYHKFTGVGEPNVNFVYSYPSTGIVEDDITEEALLKSILQGDFQPAQYLPNKNYTVTNNITTNYYRPIHQDPSSSYSTESRSPISPFSSSSNQSYEDVSSPNGPTYDTVSTPRYKNTFGEGFRNGPFSNHITQLLENNGNPCSPKTMKPVENVENADLHDTITTFDRMCFMELIDEDFNCNEITDIDNIIPTYTGSIPPLELYIDSTFSTSSSIGTEDCSYSNEQQRSTEELRLRNVTNAKIKTPLISSQPAGTIQGRRIKPWSTLNLPPVKASERLKNAVDPKKVECAMNALLKLSVEELAKPDKDGDTMLMCLVGNPNELAKKMAYLAPLVERLKTKENALSATNSSGIDALYLAALKSPQYSYVTGYLAAALLEKVIDVSQRLYNSRGDTLMHLVAAQGDSHSEVLAELLDLKTNRGIRVFDLSTCNYDGKTVLHVAIESHGSSTKKVVCLETVQLLLKCGANPILKEHKSGNNALHMAISLSSDPRLVKVLLHKHAAELVNAVNYNGDTALHFTAILSNSVSPERQKKLFLLLIQAGGRTNLLNKQNKSPLALVSPDRKQIISNIL